MARGNHILFFEVNNRGNKLALGAFDEGVTGGAADRNGLTSPGDGWLLRAGYTVVWFGWEMDVLPGMNRIGMAPVIARNHGGSPVTGIVRSEMITPVEASSLPIGLSQQIQAFPPGRARREGRDQDGALNPADANLASGLRIERLEDALPGCGIPRKGAKVPVRL